MANLFDASNAPEGEPTEIVVGDYIQWKRSDLVDDYPPAQYSAEYVARIIKESIEVKDKPLEEHMIVDFRKQPEQESLI